MCVSTGGTVAMCLSPVQVCLLLQCSPSQSSIDFVHNHLLNRARSCVCAVIALTSDGIRTDNPGLSRSGLFFTFILSIYIFFTVCSWLPCLLHRFMHTCWSMGHIICACVCAPVFRWCAFLYCRAAVCVCCCCCYSPVFILYFH